MHTAWIQHVHLISVPHNIIESAMCCGEECVPITLHLLTSTRCSGLLQQEWQAIRKEALRRLALSARHGGGGGGGGGGAFNQKCTELNFRFSWISFSFRLIDKLSLTYTDIFGFCVRMCVI